MHLLFHRPIAKRNVLLSLMRQYSFLNSHPWQPSDHFESLAWYRWNSFQHFWCARKQFGRYTLPWIATLLENFPAWGHVRRTRLRQSTGITVSAQWKAQSPQKLDGKIILSKALLFFSRCFAAPTFACCSTSPALLLTWDTNAFDLDKLSSWNCFDRCFVKYPFLPVKCV